MDKLIIANWKMNPAAEKEAVRLARREDFKNVVVVPPFPFLSAAGKVLKKSYLGAQDIFWEKEGAYTGEVSPRQLKLLGVQYVIVGHSERRAMGETDRDISKKIGAALEAGLRVVLCIGELSSIRRKGFIAAKNHVRKQLNASLKNFKDSKSLSRLLNVAYEPVWAISSRSGGKSDTPEDAVLMARFIKEFLKAHYGLKGIRVLYGGSVNSRNAKSFLSFREIDGALVGGASLRAGEFKKIMKLVA